MAGISVEAVGIAHCEVLAALHATAFAEPWPAEAFARLLSAPGAAAMIARGDDGEPAGFVLCRHAGGESEILTIAVRPQSRRRGTARALVSAACAALPEDVGEIFIEVAESNAPGRALYAALDFRTVGRRAGYYVAGSGREDALVMHRALR
jgi:ribosomal-protein-alanine N-acetyltransferase